MSVRAGGADQHRRPTAAMKIGDPVLHQGRRYYLRGLDPMSVPDRQAFLEDARTGKELIVPVEEIEPEPPGDASPLRRV
jgi:hypothetical protein